MLVLRAALLSLSVGLSALACAPSGPSQGPSAVRAKQPGPDPVEVEVGRRTDEMLLAEVKAYQDPKLQSYLDGVLARVTRAADAADHPWLLRILDTSHATVRSAPAGHVYVTRGLLAFLDSEAELAAALAHEVAHVVEHDWRTQTDFLEAHGIDDGDTSRLTRADRLSLLAKLRDDERRADARAIGLLARAGYAPDALLKVIGLFASFEREAGGNRVPPLLRTHPETAARLEALKHAVKDGGESRANEYLAAIDGLLFGEDPRTGFLYGERYVNPEADFELALPPPWRTRLVGRDLLAAMPGKATVAVLSRSEHGDLDATASALASTTSGKFEPTTLAGRRAFVALGTEEGGLVTRMALLDTAGGAYVLAVVVPTADQQSPAVKAVFDSLRPIADPALRAVKPLRIRVMALPRTMSLRQLEADKPSLTNLDTLALLNGVSSDAVLTAGTRVKRVAE